MSYQGVRFVPTAQQPDFRSTMDQSQESVDLLHMVPDTGSIHRHPDDNTRSSGYVTTPHRRVLLVQADQGTSNCEVDDLSRSREIIDAPPASATTHAHICQTCSREVGMYYEQQGDSGHYSCHKTRAPDSAHDGSMYFNYLQFASRIKPGMSQNQSTPRSETVYEAVGRNRCVDEHNSKSIKTSRPSKLQKENTTTTLTTNKNKRTLNEERTNNRCRNFVYNCCKKTNQSKAKTGLQCSDNYKKCTDDGTYNSLAYNHRYPSLDSTPTLLNTNRGRKASEWSRVKRLLFLVGILLGILVALGGIVIGFIILAPHRNKAPSCDPPTPVYCDDIGCVHTTAVCLGLILCPNVILTRLCGQNVSDETHQAGQQEPEDASMEVITIVPEFEEPIKDADGWVYFSQGSGYDSGSKYTIINRAMMFAAAQKECRTRGGHLPFVNSLREQIFLEDFITQELMNPDIRRESIGFWLGARRARGSHSGTCSYKQWKWVDVYGRNHGVINGFTVFAKDKPDNYFNPEECLYISHVDPSLESFLKWDDAPCDIPTIGSIKVICEVDDR